MTAPRGLPDGDPDRLSVTAVTVSGRRYLAAHLMETLARLADCRKGVIQGRLKLELGLGNVALSVQQRRLRAEGRGK